MAYLHPDKIKSVQRALKPRPRPKPKPVEASGVLMQNLAVKMLDARRTLNGR